MILSHQGTYEFGSPKRPKFAEAIILYYLDEIDSKLFQMREFIRQQGGEDDTGPWTGYNRWLGRYLLRDAARFITDPSQEESSLAPSLDAIKREPSLFEGLSG
jgi:3'-5' exoribonuclease